jgi:uncharacterized protein YydD (DUF2326 family)
VQAFHALLVANRKGYLEAELARLERAIALRMAEIRKYTDERAKLLSILESHGALAEYSRLQQSHTERVSKLEEIKARIANLKGFEEGKSALHIDREQLQLEARSDYEDRAPIRKRAISLFNANSEALYKVPGKLIVDVAQNGFRFDVQIERSGSTGIEKMKVFCYDMMLAQLWSERAAAPGFLIHDSTIFDGVDERQVAHALQLAARLSEEFGFQYICCLNSDKVPWSDFGEGFDLETFKVLDLTDESPGGSLLGFRLGIGTSPPTPRRRAA